MNFVAAKVGLHHFSERRDSSPSLPQRLLSGNDRCDSEDDGSLWRRVLVVAPRVASSGGRVSAHVEHFNFAVDLNSGAAQFTDTPVVTFGATPDSIDTATGTETLTSRSRSPCSVIV